jgi:hypothetical protein
MSWGCICSAARLKRPWRVLYLEQDPDRWASQVATGQECWQIVSEWGWNLRLELGHQLHPDPVRTTEFAPATPPVPVHTAPPSGSAPPQVGLSWKHGRFSGQDFSLQPDGTLRCPTGQSLFAHEHPRRNRWEPARGVCGQHPQLSPLSSAGAVSLARKCHCEAAPGERAARIHSSSVLLRSVFRDWSRRLHRRACMHLLRQQRVQVQVEPGLSASPALAPAPLSRAQRAQYRLDFQERLARNARLPAASQVTIRLFGVPAGFAASLGLVPAYYRFDSRWVLSSRASMLLRVEPPALFSWLFLNPSHLLPFLLSIPLFLPSLTGFTSGSARLSLIRSGCSSSTTSLRNSWAVPPQELTTA